MSDSDNDNASLPPPPPPLPRTAAGSHARTSSDAPHPSDAPTADSSVASSPVLLGRMSRSSNPWHPGSSTPSTPPITDTFEPLYRSSKKRRCRCYLVTTLTIIALACASVFGYYLATKREIFLSHLHEHHHHHHENLTTTDTFVSTLEQSENPTEPVTTSTLWSTDSESKEITPKPPVPAQPVENNELPADVAATTETTQDVTPISNSDESDTEAIMSIKKLPPPKVNTHLFDALSEGMHLPSNLLKRGATHEFSPEEIEDMITNGRKRQETAATPEDEKADLAEHNTSESDEDASHAEQTTPRETQPPPVETSSDEQQKPQVPPEETVPEESIPDESAPAEELPPEETSPTSEQPYSPSELPSQPSTSPEPQPPEESPTESTPTDRTHEPTQPAQEYPTEPTPLSTEEHSQTTEGVPAQPSELPFHHPEVPPEPAVVPEEVASETPEEPAYGMRPVVGSSESHSEEVSPQQPNREAQEYPAENSPFEPEPLHPEDGVPSYESEQVPPVAPAEDSRAYGDDKAPPQSTEEQDQPGEVPTQPDDTLGPLEMEVPIEFMDENSELLNEVSPPEDTLQEVSEPALQSTEASSDFNGVPRDEYTLADPVDLSNPIAQSDTIRESSLFSNDVFGGQEAGFGPVHNIEPVDKEQNKPIQPRQGSEERLQNSGEAVAVSEEEQVVPVDETHPFMPVSGEERSRTGEVEDEGQLSQQNVSAVIPEEPSTADDSQGEDENPDAMEPTEEQPDSDETVEVEDGNVDNEIETNKIGGPRGEFSNGQGPMVPDVLQQPGSVQSRGDRLSGNFEGAFDEDDELKAAGQRRSAVYRNFFKPGEPALSGLKEVPLSVFPSRILSKFEVPETSPLYIPLNNIPQSISPLNGNVANHLPFLIPEAIAPSPPVIAEPVPIGPEKFLVPPAAKVVSPIPINQGHVHAPLVVEPVVSLTPPVGEVASNLAPVNMASLFHSLSLLKPLLPGSKPLSEGPTPAVPGFIQPLPTAPGLLPVNQGVGHVPPFYDTILGLSKLIQAGKDDPSKAFGEASQSLAEEVKAKSGQIVETKSSQAVPATPCQPQPIQPSPSPPSSPTHYQSTYQAPQQAQKITQQHVFSQPQPIQKTQLPALTSTHVTQPGHGYPHATPSQEHYKQPVSTSTLNVLKANASQPSFYTAPSHAQSYYNGPFASQYEHTPSLYKYLTAPRPAPKNQLGIAEPFGNSYAKPITHSNVQTVPVSYPANHRGLLPTGFQSLASQKYYQPYSHATIKPEVNHLDASQNAHVTQSTYHPNHAPANQNPLYYVPSNLPKVLNPTAATYPDQHVQPSSDSAPASALVYSNQLAASLNSPSIYPYKPLKETVPSPSSKSETPTNPITTALLANPSLKDGHIRLPVHYTAAGTSPSQSTLVEVNPKAGPSYTSIPTASNKNYFLANPQPTYSYYPKAYSPYSPYSFTTTKTPASKSYPALTTSSSSPTAQKQAYTPQPINASNFTSVSLPGSAPNAYSPHVKPTYEWNGKQTPSAVSQPKPSVETKPAIPAAKPTSHVAKPDVVITTNPSTGAKKTYVPTETVLKPQVVSFTPSKPLTEIQTPDTHSLPGPSASQLSKNLLENPLISQYKTIPINSYPAAYLLQTQPAQVQLTNKLTTNTLAAKSTEPAKQPLSPDPKRAVPDSRPGAVLSENPTTVKSLAQPTSEKAKPVVPSVERVLSHLKQEQPKASPATPTFYLSPLATYPNPSLPKPSSTQDNHAPQIQLAHVPSVNEPSVIESRIPQSQASILNLLQPQIISPPVAPSQLINVFQIPFKRPSESSPIPYAAYASPSQSLDSSPAKVVPDVKPTQIFSLPKLEQISKPLPAERIFTEAPKPLPKAESPPKPSKIFDFKPLKPSEVVTPRPVTGIVPSNQPSGKAPSPPTSVHSTPTKTPQAQPSSPKPEQPAFPTATLVQAKPNIATPLTKEDNVSRKAAVAAPKPEVAESSIPSNSVKVPQASLPYKDATPAYLRTLPIANLKSDSPLVIPQSFLNVHTPLSLVLTPQTGLNPSTTTTTPAVSSPYHFASYPLSWSQPRLTVK